VICPNLPSCTGNVCTAPTDCATGDAACVNLSVSTPAVTDPQKPIPVPALDARMLALLALLLGAAGWFAQRKRRE
jgi:hypothetical protein